MNVVAWVASLALAIGGGVFYLAWSTDWAWWVGTLMTFPLVVLVILRGLEKKEDDSADSSHITNEGPWGPP